MRITLQVFVICIYQLLAYIWWTFEVEEVPWLPFDHVQNYYSEFVWLVWNAMPPFVYLIFNK